MIINSTTAIMILTRLSGLGRVKDDPNSPKNMIINSTTAIMIWNGLSRLGRVKEDPTNKHEVSLGV